MANTLLSMFLVLSILDELNSKRVCHDRAKWCSKLGTTEYPLSRCYNHNHEQKCCESCQRLALSIPECPYGDRESWCSALSDLSSSLSQCYEHNKTCCQTCNADENSLHKCAHGDQMTWCSGIGVRYSISSCYEHEEKCCTTCNKLRQPYEGCPFGDLLTWCRGIGDLFSLSHCETSTSICCETCRLMRERQQRESGMTSKAPLTEPAKISSTASFNFRAKNNRIRASTATWRILSLLSSTSSLSPTTTSFIHNDDDYLDNNKNEKSRTITSENLSVNNGGNSYALSATTSGDQNANMMSFNINNKSPVRTEKSDRLLEVDIPPTLNKTFHIKRPPTTIHGDKDTDGSGYGGSQNDVVENSNKRDDNHTLPDTDYEVLLSESLAPRNYCCFRSAISTIVIMFISLLFGAFL